MPVPHPPMPVSHPPRARGLVPLVLATVLALLPGPVGAQSGAPGCSAPVRLHLLPTGAVPCAGTFRVDVGQTTTLGSGTSDGGQGSGNQTYHLRADLAVSSRLSLTYLFENNDDPTWGRIRGERFDKEFWFMGGGLRALVVDGDRTRLTAEGSLGLFALKSEVGLFTNRPGFERTGYLAGSAGLSLDRELGSRWTGTVAASVVVLPGETGGRPFLGRATLLGAGLRGAVHPRLSLFATGDLVLGPGHNHVDEAGDFRRIPLAAAGAIYRVNPQLSLTGYVTNQAGGTAPLRHVTLLGSVPVEAGLRLQWEPTGTLPEGIPSERFQGEVVATADQRESRSVLASVVLGRDFAVEVGASWTPGLLARERFGLNIGGEAQYRAGGRVRLARADAGAPLDVTARLTVGRSVETQQGHLVAEVRAGTTRGPLRLEVAPALAQNGGETPVAVELRTEVTGPVGITGFLVPTVLLTPHPTAWTVGLRSPELEGAFLELYGTTAQSRLGIGRFIADGARARVGVALRYAWR